MSGRGRRPEWWEDNAAAIMVATGCLFLLFGALGNWFTN